MMEISEINALIISLAPTVSAVIGIIVSLVVGVKRIKQDNIKTIKEIHSSNADLAERVEQVVADNEELTRENLELKKDLRKVMAKLNHVHIEEDK